MLSRQESLAYFSTPAYMKDSQEEDAFDAGLMEIVGGVLYGSGSSPTGASLIDLGCGHQGRLVKVLRSKCGVLARGLDYVVPEGHEFLVGDMRDTPDRS